MKIFKLCLLLVALFGVQTQVLAQEKFQDEFGLYRLKTHDDLSFEFETPNDETPLISLGFDDFDNEYFYHPKIIHQDGKAIAKVTISFRSAQLFPVQAENEHDDTSPSYSWYDVINAIWLFDCQGSVQVANQVFIQNSDVAKTKHEPTDWKQIQTGTKAAALQAILCK